MRKILSLILVAGIVLGVCTVAMASGFSRAASDFEYRISGHGIEITKYTGKGIQEVVVPGYIDGLPVTSIGTWAFTDVGTEDETMEEYSMPRSDISSIVLPDTIESIAPYAFDSLAALTDIVLPDSVNRIGRGAFLACTSLKSVKLPAGISEIPEEAFRGCALETVMLPAGVKRIGEAAFAEEYMLRQVRLNDGLEEIGAEAFGGDQMLTAIEIPDSVTEIGIGALGLTALHEVTIPACVEVIEPGLLMWCRSLVKVKFSGIPDRIAKNAFLDCPELREIEVDATESEWRQVAIDHDGNGDFLDAHVVYLRSEHAAPQTPEPAPSESEDITVHVISVPEDITISTGSPLAFRKAGSSWYITGYEAGTLSTARHDAELINSMELPGSLTVRVLHTGSNLRAADSTVLGTGDLVVFEEDGIFAGEAQIVIKGDVQGSGVIGLSQLVRLAAAFSGSRPLEGPYLEAGDLDGSGSVTLSDIVLMSNLLKNS